MTFEYDGYPVKFIQKDACRDASKHLFTLIYKFFSPVTKYHYIIQAQEHVGNVYAVKFYCKKDRRSDYKFSKITNRGDFGNIMISCLSILPDLLRRIPNASFAFSGAHSMDSSGKKRETNSTTQRYRVYKYVVSNTIGGETFEHFQYASASCYLLVNKSVGNIEEKEREIVSLFSETYTDLSELQ